MRFLGGREENILVLEFRDRDGAGGCRERPEVGRGEVVGSVLVYLPKSFLTSHFLSLPIALHHEDATAVRHLLAFIHSNVLSVILFPFLARRQPMVIFHDGAFATRDETIIASSYKHTS